MCRVDDWSGYQPDLLCFAADNAVFPDVNRLSIDQPGKGIYLNAIGDDAGEIYWRFLVKS